MATLADSFLADFESSGEEESEVEEENKGGDEPEFAEFDKQEEVTADIDDLDATVQDLDDLDQPMSEVEPAKKSGVASVSALLTDASLTNHLKTIANLMEKTNAQRDAGEDVFVDRDEEYNLIVKSNELAAVVDNEIATIHKFVRDIYATKLQELEQLVHNPLDYAKVVKIIGNETDMTTVESELLGIIPQTTILTISVTATTTVGKPLPADELRRAFDGCDAIIELEEGKRCIYEYIESRMFFIAPNLSTLIGTAIAARLMAIAGGLAELSKIPACNLQVLGARKKTLDGFARTSADMHMGLLSFTALVLGAPRHLRARTVKVLAGRASLCARVDAFHEDPTGEVGQSYVDEIVKKVAKWQEPPPAKKKKALAAPLGEMKTKRGGKRKRAEKAKYEVTDMAKAKNKMLFGKAELTDDYTGEGMGMVGQAGSGRLTVKKKDTQKLAKKLSRKTQAKLRRVKGTVASASGMASSIAFTPIQGMELVAPDQPKQKAHNKYFSMSGGFVNVSK
jgi:U4/U6 small nuclear ribonucleoprotein PRP31